MERFQFSLNCNDNVSHIYTHKHYLPTITYQNSVRERKKNCYRKDAVTCNINSLFKSKFRLVIRCDSSQNLSRRR